MGYFFFAFGILCVAYYVLMSIYNKRLNTTFSWFWILFGILQILLGMIVLQTEEWLDWIIYGICIACGVIYLAVEFLILTAMLRRPKKNLDCLIVLGAQVRGERVTDTLKRRLDKALAYLQENEQTVCVVSGGRGKGEDISEALAMSRYLIACGIEEERIILEAESTSTRENLMYCLDCIDNPDKEKIGIVTNNFHIYRSLRLAKKLGYKKVYPVVAGCNMIYLVNYITREFFAILALWNRNSKIGR